MTGRAEPRSPSDAGLGPAAGVPAPDAAIDGVVHTCPNAAEAGRTISARWLDTTEYCGNNARLEVTVAPACGGSATVELLHPATGATLATLSGPLTNGVAQITWVAKAASAAWRTDRIGFRASAAGLTALSSNNFTFRARPTAALSVVDVSQASASAVVSAVCQHHDAQLDAGRVRFGVKIRTLGDPFPVAKQTAAKAAIEAAWNNGFTGKAFHRTGCLRGNTCDCPYDCCKVSFLLDADFVATGEHLLATVAHSAPGATRIGSWTQGGAGRPVTARWGDPARDATSTYAHEVGHMLGQYDEYASGVTDPAGVQPATPAAGGENLMSTTGNTVLLNRHYRHALAYLNAQAGGDTYEIIPP